VSEITLLRKTTTPRAVSNHVVLSSNVHKVVVGGLVYHSAEIMSKTDSVEVAFSATNCPALETH